MPENWDSFSRSNHPYELRIRRADPQHPLDFFYGKDFEGNYVFTLRCRFAEDTPHQPHQLAGIDVHLFSHGADKIELRLCLLDSAQVDIFKVLCANLMSATERLDRNQQSAGIEIVLRRLARWQDLLRTRREKVLSRNQIIGFWGELLAFRDLFLAHLPAATALATWRGPFGDEQDFLFNDRLIEVKTQLSSSDRKVQISSAEQLDTVSGEVFLCHQLIGPANLREPAMSLNQLADEVLHLLKEAGAPEEVFLAILVESGYMKRDEYDEEKWLLNERTFYRVDTDFPAIKASDLAGGICDVRYSIRTDSISSHAVVLEKFVNDVFGIIP
jgi:hypothetical protein